MMIIPYRLETTFTRLPLTNLILVAVTSIVFFFVWFGVIPIDVVEAMVLRDWDLGQMIGCLFLHGGLFHLLGNMLFLWIFGNAVCAAVGNVQFGLIYLFLGIVASTSHLAFNGGAAIGASGAINGIVGMSLVLYPVNKLNCFYFYSLPFVGMFWKYGTFAIKAYWMILFWLVFDILGAIFGGGNIAYWAHLGGFGAGMLIAYSLLLFKIIETFDPTLIEVLTGKAVEREIYDIDELAARIRPAAKQEAVFFESDRIQEQALQPDPSLQPAELPKEPLPSLRVLKTTQREKDIYIYFINEGDTIGNVALESKDTISAEINPNTLNTRSPGWMKIINAESSALQNLDFAISYDDGTGKRTSKQMRYDEPGRRFLVAQ
jgi:membrane associated rhomboid family serine protease